MLNTYNPRINNNTDIKINACSGGIYKTYPESFFLRFHLKSDLSEKLLCANPIVKIKTGETYPEYEYIDAVIIQMVICGDLEIMAEIIRKTDFDKYFTELNKE